MMIVIFFHRLFLDESSQLFLFLYVITGNYSLRVFILKLFASFYKYKITMTKLLLVLLLAVGIFGSMINT